MSRELLKMSGVFWDTDRFSTAGEVGSGAALGATAGGVMGFGSKARPRNMGEAVGRGLAGAVLGGGVGAGVGGLYRFIRHQRGIDDGGFVSQAIGVDSVDTMFDSAILGGTAGLAARYV
jgi:hypothetical protein